jgi:uncharacterized membrane protein YkoI
MPAESVGSGKDGVKNRLKTWLIILLLAVTLPAAALAQSLEEAARKAAKQYDAKVLSARTIKRGDQDVHEIRLLTKNGVVKTVKIPDRRKKKKPN